MKDRDINDIGQLCNFEILANRTMRDDSHRLVQARVSYLMIQGREPGEGVTYDGMHYVGGIINGNQKRHVIIPGPIPHLCYNEPPGKYDGLVVADTEEEIGKIRPRTAVFFVRKLYAMRVASKITDSIDVNVGKPEVEDIEPLHFSFLVSPGFNFAVSRLTFDVEGPIMPVEGKLGVYGNN